MQSIYEKRKSLASDAELNLLEPFNLIDMIDKFAQAFGLHPDEVFNKTSFGTVTNFLIKWTKEGEGRDRYFELERVLNTPPPKAE